MLLTSKQKRLGDDVADVVVRMKREDKIGRDACVCGPNDVVSHADLLIFITYIPMLFF